MQSRGTWPSPSGFLPWHVFRAVFLRQTSQCVFILGQLFHSRGLCGSCRCARLCSFGVDVSPLVHTYPGVKPLGHGHLVSYCEGAAHRPSPLLCCLPTPHVGMGSAAARLNRPMWPLFPGVVIYWKGPSSSSAVTVHTPPHGHCPVLGAQPQDVWVNRGRLAQEGQE